MKQITVFLKKPINTIQRIEFENKLFYVSENIEKFYFDEVKSCYTLYLKINISQAECYKMLQYIEKLLEQEIYCLKDIKDKRVWEYPCSVYFNQEKLIQDLIEKNLVFIPQKGQVGFSSPIVDLFEFFDSLLCKLSMHFGAKRYYFPTFLSCETIDKAGYFESFPNRLFFVNRMKNEMDNYILFKRQFAKGVKQDGYIKEINKYQCSTNFCLPPTMCYYFYEAFQGKEIKNMVVTTRGRSFRYENDYAKNFSRLFDFTIRETVFLGDYKYVKNSLNTYRKMLCMLMEKLGLGGYCETASDPFFLTGNSADRINSQKIFSSKYELRLNVDCTETIAVSSINEHGQYISKRFDLYQDIGSNKYLNTGCTGTGLERLVFSFLCQYGADEEKWPNYIKSYIRGEDYTEHIIKDVVYALCDE